MKLLIRSISPYCDVKDVASHRAGHGHVTHAFTCHNHAGDEVGNGRPRSQNSQAHDLLRDADGFTHLRRVGGGQRSEWKELQLTIELVTTSLVLSDFAHKSKEVTHF